MTRRASIRAVLLAAALLAALPARAQETVAGEVAILRPWSRPALQGGTAAGFMTLRSTGAADRLLSATTPAARLAELHSMTMDGGVMRMRPVEGIAVPAGGTVTLAPGGLHLMLIGLAAPLRAGDRVPVTLTFERAGNVQVELTVEAPGRPGATRTEGHAH
ncbi:copper chaperone PCu(A)C [Roseomonas sp. CCTCC AB2023176]|uniref:copper chaperone PCu(A)C n=1 Tax=Roseomonas sp. CCTCC AB2023176 TaxID=3342640 RepID=UPI0035E252DF